jgi:hypothetical protein
MRVAATPVTGLVVGGSFARGEFLSRRVRSLLAADRDESYAQQTYGLDAEYSRDHWLIRTESVLSEWHMPLPDNMTRLPLRALATSVEGRYTFVPGFYGAARAEHLGFNRIAGAIRTDEWDAPVVRLEIGAGYYLRRNVVARASVQFNDRDGGRVESAKLVAGQLLYWF